MTGQAAQVTHRSRARLGSSFAAEVAAEMFKLTERFADPAAGGAKRCREVQE